MARFINFASYNLDGFQQGKTQLLELCDSHDIIAIQEHWLSNCDLDRIGMVWYGILEFNVPLDTV